MHALRKIQGSLTPEVGTYPSMFALDVFHVVDIDIAKNSVIYIIHNYMCLFGSCHGICRRFRFQLQLEHMQGGL